MRQPRLGSRIGRRGRFGVLLLAGLLVFPACRVTDLTLWHSPKPKTESCEVAQIRDVTYYTGPEADERHKLDLFLPRGVKQFPVAFFVHGGAWLVGDNRCCGLYSSVGEFLARHGVGAVLPNYRLSPGVKHPAHITDVARAFAWTRAHCAEFGGCPDRMVLVGHSAGGHLVALLATDDRYLRAEGCQPSDIKGVFAVSGPYHIPEGNLDLRLGGSEPMALRADHFLPLRGHNWTRRLLLPGIPFELNLFGPVFGTDAAVRHDASPVNHVHPGLPPFLLCYADNDLPTLEKMAHEFHHALRDQGVESRLCRIEDRNHHSIIFRAVEAGDEVGGRMLGFIQRQVGGVR
jgi:acetyl esterase/lipase